MIGQKDQVLLQTEKLATESLELVQGHTVGRMEELGNFRWEWESFPCPRVYVVDLVPAELKMNTNFGQRDEGSNLSFVTY